jgi:hypothetical protein
MELLLNLTWQISPVDGVRVPLALKAELRCNFFTGTAGVPPAMSAEREMGFTVLVVF